MSANFYYLNECLVSESTGIDITTIVVSICSMCRVGIELISHS